MKISTVVMVPTAVDMEVFLSSYESDCLDIVDLRRSPFQQDVSEFDGVVEEILESEEYASALEELSERAVSGEKKLRFRRR